MLRIRLESGDHNDDFAQVLPRDGMVDAFLTASDGNDWALFRPDRPVDYEGRSYDNFLLRSRWVGHEIGDGTATSVFVLLVPDMGKPRSGFNVEDFHHGAWGEIDPLRARIPQRNRRARAVKDGHRW